MNKDVIYIEAEDDITDILSKVKNAKNKIVALVPPKKAGVLHSAVNFKLITKTATKAEKTVVLVSADESLKRLAATANIPVAKTLQSKPQLPHADDAVEFGDEVNDEVVEVEDDEQPKKIEVKKVDEAASDEEEQPKKKTGKKAEEAAAVAKKSKKSVEPEEIEDDVIEEEKPTRKKSDKKVPNFKKYQKFIIAGILAAILIVGFLIWALVIAPAAKVIVSVTMYPNSLSEKVTFTDVEGNDDVDNGILYSESKTLTKTVKAEFAATGELDKGTKASGTITVTRGANTEVDCFESSGVSALSIPEGTTVKIGDKEYVTTKGASVNVNLNDESKIGSSGIGRFQKCYLKVAISSGKIPVVAKAVGEAYNVGASTNVSISISTTKKYTVSSDPMTGGTSKIVKIVSEKDIQDAESNLDMSIDGEARDELIDEFGDEYILISSSFSSDNGKITTSPALNEEVGDGVTPQIVKEVKYTIYAVRRDDVERFIKKIAEATITGDDTQMVHDTGIDKAFIDTFKDTGNGTHTGKIKTTFMTGPKITEQIVLEKVKGKRLGEVQPLIKSIKGVKQVEVKPSYFWVTTVPNDPNKISIEINSDQE